MLRVNQTIQVCILMNHKQKKSEGHIKCGDIYYIMIMATEKVCQYMKLQGKM